MEAAETRGAERAATAHRTKLGGASEPSRRAQSATRPPRGLLVPREGAVVPAVVPWPPAGRMCLRRPFDLYPAGTLEKVQQWLEGEADGEEQVKDRAQKAIEMALFQDEDEVPAEEKPAEEKPVEEKVAG
mmetsp:Transcript_58526/g.130848  ORF Transcript_58526/g.130848 Transcript_58526/m.130848 type:complete len:130 (+) Transcript_58526:502-891(+)